MPSFRTRFAVCGLVVSAVSAFACGQPGDDVVVSADELTTADPKAGFDYLVNGGYIQCGFPKSVFNVVDFLGQSSSAPAWEESHLEGRSGDNADLPYSFTNYRTPGGANLVVTNCLQCHAGHLNGKLVLGLGATDVDFSRDLSGFVKASDPVVRVLLTGESDAEWKKLVQRTSDIAGYNQLGTRGPTIANMLMPAISAHQNPETLEWQSNTSYYLPPAFELPVDVPPWWNLKKKKAMFYTTAGKGDFTKHMMLASSFCIDNVEDAKEINSHFADVKAFIETIQPPRYPFPINATVAARGQEVFARTCAGCHGTAGAGGSYPNVVVNIGALGTDSLLLHQVAGSPEALAWHDASYFGEGAPLKPEPGYIAPPLDGVWATAPYLHNGSVPTLRALLDSRTRPRYWRRSFRSTDYDARNVGWNFEVESAGKDAFWGGQRLNLYDTTLAGFTNTGHTYGDALSDHDRDDLIEYLKTL